MIFICIFILLFCWNLMLYSLELELLFSLFLLLFIIVLEYIIYLSFVVVVVLQLQLYSLFRIPCYSISLNVSNFIPNMFINRIEALIKK